MPEDMSLDIRQFGADEIRQLHKDTLKRHRSIIRRQKIVRKEVLFRPMDYKS